MGEASHSTAIRCATASSLLSDSVLLSFLRHKGASQACRRVGSQCTLSHAGNTLHTSSGHLETTPLIVTLATCIQQGANYLTTVQSTPILECFM